MKTCVALKKIDMIWTIEVLREDLRADIRVHTLMPRLAVRQDESGSITPNQFRSHIIKSQEDL